ncbi:hypothetical protein ACFPL7_23270 [Dongia soli]|uniref:Uncharacterized protein n=1 Tax=Dongia soli TaxID=600628 RepID=A0ABU5EGZ5_9PROT|nr:hypothetical protein [Dongia soli]MDY0885704.1 hypothetical protein [Dongia soli]
MANPASAPSLIHWSRPFLALLLAAGLAGCSSYGKIDYRQINSGYDPEQGRWIPYQKGIHADVTGNPFAMSQKDFNQLVAEAIQPNGYVPVDRGPRVRLAFNETGGTGDYICQNSGDKDSTKMGRGGDSKIRVSAAYCQGNDAVTYATGSITDVSGPDDPQFKAFLRNLTVFLFPTPESNGDVNCSNGMRC